MGFSSTLMTWVFATETVRVKDCVWFETPLCSFVFANSGRPKSRSSRETLKEFLQPFARKSFALRYRVRPCWHPHQSLLRHLNRLKVTILFWKISQQKEKTKNFKRQIIKYLESLLQSQQQVSASASAGQTAQNYTWGVSKTRLQEKHRASRFLFKGLVK